MSWIEYLFLFYDGSNVLRGWHVAKAFPSTTLDEVMTAARSRCIDGGYSNVCIFASANEASGQDLLIADIDIEDR